MDETNKPNIAGNTEPESAPTPPPIKRSGGTRVIEPLASSNYDNIRAQNSAQASTGDTDAESYDDEVSLNSFRDKPLHPSSQYERHRPNSGLKDSSDDGPIVVFIKTLIMIFGISQIISGIAGLIIHISTLYTIASVVGILFGVGFLFRREIARKITSWLIILIMIITILMAIMLMFLPLLFNAFTGINVTQSSLVIPIFATVGIYSIILIIINMKKVKQVFR